ncbi:MAG TPA: hypothetical protein VMN60_03295 [Longimicrobiales bacterium]|nr:hypothetical protein [Longimicrobiales bacterium]
MTRQSRRRSAAAVPARSRAQRVPAVPPIGAGAARALRRFVQQRPVVVALLLVAVHAVLALLTFEPRPHTGGDNAAYITLGRSLLEQGTYTELWDPLQPAHTKYPPIFPAVLAAAMAAGLTPWVQLKLIVVGFSALAVGASFLWMRARRRPLLALGVGLVLALAPGVLREGRWILSDVPFWAFTMIALWAFDRLRPDDWRRFVIAALATLLAYFTRSAGLPLVLAAFAWLAWRRSWRQLGALAAIIGLPAVLWWLRARASGPAGYVSEFWLIEPYAPELGRIGAGDLLLRITENLYKYLSRHLPELLASHASLLLSALSILIFLLALYGWGRRVRRARVADLFLPLYIGLIFVWPAVWSGERFLLPALPLVLFFAGDALTRLACRWTPRASFATGAGACALVLVVALPGLVRAVQAGRACTGLYLDGDRYPCLGGEAWQEFFGVAELSAEALPDDAVVLSRKPRLFYVLSGLRGRNYPLFEQTGAFFATVDSVAARYVVFDRLDAVSERYLRPVLTRRPAAFCLMGAAPGGTVLFGILPDHAAAPELTAEAAEAAEVGFAYCPEDYWRSAEARLRVLGP